MTPWSGRGLATLLLVGLGLAVAAPAASYAANGASIDHVETQGSQLQVLFSVPGTDPVDLSSIAVKIGSSDATAKAQDAASATDLTRTTVLAIDTSASMAGARITEAKKAALAYLAGVPANVKVGIVTFDNTVHDQVAPTTDRTAAISVVNHLTLAQQTSLYRGIIGAVGATGTTGQRQILVLSDGHDTTKVPLSKAIGAVTKSGVKVDVVSLEQSDAANAPLNALAQAGKGQVINAQDPQALSAAFASEADVLARQVLVTADVPAAEKETSANLAVSVQAGGTTYSDTAFVTIRDGKAPAPADTAGTAIVPVKASWFALSHNVVYGAVGALGVGLIGVLIALGMGTPAPSAPQALRSQLEAYGASGQGAGLTAKAQNLSLTDQAKEAAGKALASNASLEAKIAARLEAAGMSLKPAEWLLLHGGIAVGVAIVGFLLGRGSPIMLLIFLAVGAVGPWVYLGFKKSRRLKAFDSGLADTLQLMSGSLSAGLSLAQSVDTIVREGSEPITSEFKRTIVESRLGVGLEDALEGVAQRMDSRDFEWVVMAIRIQREVGGNLAELLLTVAGTLREREFLRRHVHALSAEGRLSCYVLGGLPPAFLGYLTLTKPTYVHPMFTTGIGYVLIAGMAVLLGVGVFWMSKVSKVDI